jgi:hypothetical protein
VRRAAIALALLLGACSTWPSGSYVTGDISDSDAQILAAAITDYLAGAVQPGYPVSVAVNEDAILPLLMADLDRAGIPRSATGQVVRYVVGPLDDGIFLRVSIDDRGGGSRFFAKSGGSLVTAGPMMVALP